MKISTNKIYYFITLVVTLVVLFVTNENSLNSFAQEGPNVKINEVYDTPIFDISDDLSVETQVEILEDQLLDLKIGLAYTAPVQIVEQQLEQESKELEPGIESVEEEVVDENQEINPTAGIESVIEVEKTEVLVPLSDVQLTYELNNGFKVVEDSVSAQLPSGEVVEMGVQIIDQTLVLSPKGEITESIQLGFQVEVQPDVLVGDIALTNSTTLTYKQNNNLTEADLLTPTLNIIHVNNTQNILENQQAPEEENTDGNQQSPENQQTPEEGNTDGNQQSPENQQTPEEGNTDGNQQSSENQQTPEEGNTDGNQQSPENQQGPEEENTDENKQPSEEQQTPEEGNTVGDKQLSEDQATPKEEIRLESLVYDNTILYNSVSEIDKTPGTLTTFNKSAQYDSTENKIRIDFVVEGNKEIGEKPADILLVVDTSNSMKRIVDGTDKSRIELTRKALTNFVDSLMEINGDVNIGIVTFDRYAREILPFTNDTDTIKTAISNLDYRHNVENEGGTNTEAGIRVAAEVLSSATAENQYVLFFTDGKPTVHLKDSAISSTIDNDDIDSSGGLSYYDQHFKAAQAAFYSYFETGNSVGDEVSIGGIGQVVDEGDGIHKDGSEQFIIPNTEKQAAKVYTIGLFKEEEEDDKHIILTDKAIKFLSSIQNVVSETEYKNKGYYSSDFSKINSIYTSILEEIEVEINPVIFYDTFITDEIPSQFEIVRNEDDSPLFGSNISLDSSKITTEILDNGTVELDDDTEKITFNLGNIRDENVQVWFWIKPKNDYYGECDSSGNDVNIETNVEANLTYNNGICDDSGVCGKIENDIESPVVQILPIQGNIRVEKIVSNIIGLVNQNFSIQMKGTTVPNQNQSALTVDILGNNGVKELNFYLKDDNTDITGNNDYSKGYVTAGTYTVSEIVPANYIEEKEKTEVRVCSSADEEWKDCEPIEGKSFELNKINRYIYVRVINKLENELYWYHQVHTPNRFTYTKLSGEKEE